MCSMERMAQLLFPAIALALLLQQYFALLTPSHFRNGHFNNRTSKFQLFEDFDISRTALYIHPHDPDVYLKLNSMRRTMTRPTLSFYLDKVRYKTSLQSRGVDIPKVHFMGQFENSEDEIWMNHFYPKEHHANVITSFSDRILPEIQHLRNYVAKVSHLSYGDGVVVIKDFDHNFLADFGMTEELAAPSMPPPAVATKLAKILHNPATYQTDESWALHQVPPGLVVEERITKPTISDPTIPEPTSQDHDHDQYHAHGLEDDGPAVEFKTFTIWGKAYLSIWCQAGVVHGMVFRNGTARVTTTGLFPNGTGFVHTSKEEQPLPSWIDWPRIVAISEKLGANKDMFRTDVFVGVSADSNRTLDDLKYLVSEVELHSTYGLGNLEQQVGQMWLQGYMDNDYVTIPNTEANQISAMKSILLSLKEQLASLKDHYISTLV